MRKRKERRFDYWSTTGLAMLVLMMSFAIPAATAVAAEVIDDFESGVGNWIWASTGPTVSITPVADAAVGAQAMQVSFGAKPPDTYAYITRAGLNSSSWSFDNLNYNQLAMWVKGDGSSQSVKVQLVENNPTNPGLGETWEASISLNDPNWHKVTIRFADMRLVYPSLYQNGMMDTGKVERIKFVIEGPESMPAVAFKVDQIQVEPVPAVDKTIARQGEESWIIQSQLPNGGITTYPSPTANYNNKRRIVPYFANLAAVAEVEGAADNNGQYLPNVKKWMDWYFAHFNWPDQWGMYGTVYDYDVDINGVETSLNDYDSADSYAATFLTLARKYYDATGDATYINAHNYELRVIGDIIVLLQQSDGLTWAKPNYFVKYLMDNSEGYRGLMDLSYLAQVVLGDQQLSDWYRNKAQLMINGIETVLWSSANKSYYIYKDYVGGKQAPNWSTFYPDAVAQLFPIWNEVIAAGSTKAINIYTKFNSYQVGWPNLQKGDAFPWALVGYIARLMGDSNRQETFSSNARAKFIDQGRPWPWYVGEAGFYILLNR